MTTDDLSPSIPVDELKDGPGVTHLNPKDLAYPAYHLLEAIRSPLTLRDIMIQPVRTGYIGHDRVIDPALIPPSGASLFPDIQVTSFDVPSIDGPIRCAIYRAPQTKEGAPLLLYAHGGGFMVGSSEDTDFMTRKMAAQNPVIIVSVNYRLAPEFPFPVGFNDFYKVYVWLLEHGGEIGGDPKQIVVSGDSSGSNFAAALPLKSKDEGLMRPAAVVLFGPLVDMHFEKYASFNRLAPLGVVYDTAFVGFLRGAYVPQPDLWSHPYVSPYLGNLVDYPPIMLIVGTADPIVDSVQAFAEKYQQMNSNECWFYNCLGMPHGFYFFPHVFKEEEQAFKDVQQFLARHVKLVNR